MRPHDTYPDREFRDAVLAGLAAPARAIPCKYLYDQRGSELFDAICDTPEYYLTRTELGLLGECAGALAERAGPGCRVIEFGAGSSRKLRLLLRALDVAAYVPIDVSRTYLQRETARLGEDFPGLAVHPVCADFLRGFSLPPLPDAGATLGFFPGSTIGNLSPGEAGAFLERAATVLGAGAALVVGVDLVKDVAVLEAAYDDAGGVTAAFSRNLLVRIDRELGGDFDPDAFEHRARWDADRSCIAIHLVARADQVVTVAGRRFAFARGDAIHVEDSHKYTVAGFQALAEAAGWCAEAAWTDRNGWFSLHCLRAAG